MYRRDYIMRLIERFGGILIALRNRILRREVDSAEPMGQVRDLAGQAGLDLDIARPANARRKSGDLAWARRLSSAARPLRNALAGTRLRV
jgi:hypothetical protein